VGCTPALGSISVRHRFPSLMSCLCLMTVGWCWSFTVRDTAGTALYFLEYDGMRHMLGRSRSGEQGPTPSWFPVHPSLVPFVCGSISGVWLLFLFLVFLSTIFTVRLLLGLSSIPWTCEWCSPAFISNWFFLCRVKTKIQQRALAGEKYRGPLETLHRLVRGKWTSFKYQYIPFWSL